MAGEAQRIVNVMRRVVDDNTGNGARVHYKYGVVTGTGGGYEVSAYLSADDYASSYIRVPASAYLNSGDYVLVATTDEGDNRVVEVLPYSLYSKLAFDHSNARIHIGTGTSKGDPGTAGQVLTSGGATGSAYWGAGGGGGGTVEESPARRAAANVLARHMWR